MEDNRDKEGDEATEAAEAAAAPSPEETAPADMPADTPGPGPEARPETGADAAESAPGADAPDIAAGADAPDIAPGADAPDTAPGADAPDATGSADVAETAEDAAAAADVHTPPDAEAPAAPDDADPAQTVPDDRAANPDAPTPEPSSDAEPPAPDTAPPPDAADTAVAAGAANPEVWLPGRAAETVPPDTAEPEPESDPGPFAAAAPEPDPPGPPCAAGLFGKMPARGDFIARAIAQDLLRPFEDWLMPLVQNARALLGDDWGRAWRQAPAWRFWIGADILRGEWTRSLRTHEQAGTVTGVLLPSADRQGRLFPLVLVLADDHARLMPPPVLAPPDRRWYASCDRLLLAARDGAALEAVEADLGRLRAPRLPDDAAAMAQLLAQRALWGQGAGAGDAQDAGDVWSGIRASDHHLAATGRSYWWCETPRGATSVITLAGLPDPETFAFMLTGAIPADPP